MNINYTTDVPIHVARLSVCPGDEYLLSGMFWSRMFSPLLAFEGLPGFQMFCQTQFSLDLISTCLSTRDLVSLLVAAQKCSLSDCYWTELSLFPWQSLREHFNFLQISWTSPIRLLLQVSQTEMFLVNPYMKNFEWDRSTPPRSRVELRAASGYPCCT